MSVSITIFLSFTPSTRCALLGASLSDSFPRNTANASSRFPSVADNPQTRNLGFHLRNRASANSVCTPRFDPSSSCHSSTITLFKFESCWRPPACESINDKLSGVVIKALGIFLFCFARSAVVVSPVRAPTVHGSARSMIGRSNESRVSADNARIGVIHNTVSGGGSMDFASIDSITGPNHAASVLPVPVAEWMSPLSPRKYASHTSR